MKLFEKFQQGLSYTDFLARYASEGQKQRWQQVFEEIQISPEQERLLRSWQRTMPVLCLAGTWCGDCINQCPIFGKFQSVSSVIDLRFLDRDDHADVQRELQINGGNRVPTVVFFSEDGFEVGRYGERTLSKYRALAQELAGPSCPTGVNPSNDPLLQQVTQDWLDEFERVQWVLRLSPRLRSKHGD